MMSLCKFASTTMKQNECCCYEVPGYPAPPTTARLRQEQIANRVRAAGLFFKNNAASAHAMSSGSLDSTLSLNI